MHLDSKNTMRTHAYRRGGRPSGTAQLALHGGLFAVTYFGHHKVVTELFDVGSATKQFRRRLNTRWVVPGALTFSALIVLSLIVGLLSGDEHGGTATLFPFGLSIVAVLATLLSLFFLKNTVVLRFFDHKKIHRVEVDYNPGAEPVLDAVVTAAFEFDTPTGPHRLSDSVRHSREWLPAFVFRYIVARTWLVYTVIQCALVALIIMLSFVLFLFMLISAEPTEPSTLADPSEPSMKATVVATLVTASPALCVLFYVAGQLRKGKGAWSNRSKRRRILRLARKGNLPETYRMLGDMLVAQPNDYESGLLLTQFHMADGDFDSARRCILHTTGLTDAQRDEWNLHIDYVEALDGRNPSADGRDDRAWSDALAAFEED